MIQLIALIGLLIGVAGMGYLITRKQKELVAVQAHTLPEEAFVSKAMHRLAPKLKFDFKKISIKNGLVKVKEGAWFKKSLMKIKVILLKLENKVDTWLNRIAHTKKFNKDSSDQKTD